MMPVTSIALREEKSLVQEVLGWLVRQSYTHDQAVDVATRLYAHKDLWMALVELVERNTEPSDLRVAGVHYRTLRQKYHMTPVNALLTLGWLSESPDEAIRALQYGIR